MFAEIQRRGGIDDAEMAQVFNLGLGMVVVVPPDDVSRTLSVLREQGHAAAEVGRITAGGARQVRLV